MKYILSIDQGTTGTTAMLVEAKTLKPVAKANTEFKQHYPDQSWVEHDLHDIWRSVEHSVLQVIKLTENKYDFKPEQICAIGITNQRETTCAYNKNGEPLAKAIVWQDRRTFDFCQKNKENYKLKKLQLKTGLPLDPYFSATKMNWLLEKNSHVRKAFQEDNLRLSTIDSYLLYKLTNHTSFFTDATNASRTLLMDLESCQWDNELLHFFNIPENVLPQIKPNTHVYGLTENCNFLPDGIPILSMIGDQQSALLGQKCIKAGEMKCTYGTGAFLLLNTGMEITHSQKGLLTTVAFKSDMETYYALEGSTYIAGAAVGWLRDNLNILEDSLEVEILASRVSDHDIRDLYFFPFFTGIGTPYWNSEAKAALIGMTRATSKEHIARAALEGIALSVNDTFEVFQNESNSPIKNLRVDGGASLNQILMQMQADFSGVQIERPQYIETTAMGAAYGAYLKYFHKEIQELKKLEHNHENRFRADSNELYEEKKSFWKKYIEKNFVDKTR